MFGKQASSTLGFRVLVSLAVLAGVVWLAYPPSKPFAEAPNRIPEPSPYDTVEATAFPPPFEEYWKDENHAGQCQSCHAEIFAEWNGSMMSNSWRDPAWRGAYLLSVRQTSTQGNCGTPDPPDGSRRARPNPFADGDGCSSTFQSGTEAFTTARSGSLLDGFCSRCHMPTNYIDNIPLHNVRADESSGMEHGRLDPKFDPTSDNGTGIAFATLEAQLRNTESGKSGLFCAFCHSISESRLTPFNNYALHPVHSQDPASLPDISAESLPARQDAFQVPDPDSLNLGYAVGAGSFRLSPRAIALSERLGPLSSPAHPEGQDDYLSGVFDRPIPYQNLEAYDSKHRGFRQVLYSRAEYCAACHDVTNPLTILNGQGKWVGGFPIERTYTEWAYSRYADRPGNSNFDPAFKRDCQTCHMQQDYDQPGTAQTLYDGQGTPRPPLSKAVASDAPPRAVYATHHFIGGNAYIPQLIGASVDEMGSVQPYPELSVFSFSSDDPDSLYYNAYWTNVGPKGPPTQHARLAWDRLRNVLDLDLSGPESAQAGTQAPLKVRVANSGSGHKFPTGFPEGRAAWVAVRAFDLASGQELLIHDSEWGRTSLGVGYLTREDQIDPNFPDCKDQWKIPAGSADPYAVQFKAIASVGDGCPTLDLVYAHPLNLVVNSDGQPIDEGGQVISRANPESKPQFRDFDGDGDLFDDAYLKDTRLRPLLHPDASLLLDRYSVVIPSGLKGPVAVTAAVYYQSLEAVVAKKFLGNLADLDTDSVLEPCVLQSACDGRKPSIEPAAVEGAPPVPMEVRNWLIRIKGGRLDDVAPRLATYPVADAEQAHKDTVVKAIFSEPVQGIDHTTFRLFDSEGSQLPAFVDQIGDSTWGLFTHQVFLNGGEAYSARIEAGICDGSGNCTQSPAVWNFRIAEEAANSQGDTTIPIGFAGEVEQVNPPPLVLSVEAAAEGGVTAFFSEPVMNVNSKTLVVYPRQGGCNGSGPPIAGRITSNSTGDRWTFTPFESVVTQADHCLTVGAEIYDMAGKNLERPYSAAFQVQSGMQQD